MYRAATIMPPSSRREVTPLLPLILLVKTALNDIEVAHKGRLFVSDIAASTARPARQADARIIAALLRERGNVPAAAENREVSHPTTQ
jgi:hypothetical protein